MKLYGALVLFLTLSAACGLRCYICVGANPKSCTGISVCPDIMDRCSSFYVGGHVTKACMNSNLCINPISCCEGDLCNGAIPTGPSVILLLVSSAIITLFL